MAYENKANEDPRKWVVGYELATEWPNKSLHFPLTIKGKDAEVWDDLTPDHAVRASELGWIWEWGRSFPLRFQVLLFPKKYGEDTKRQAVLLLELINFTGTINEVPVLDLSPLCGAIAPHIEAEGDHRLRYALSRAVDNFLPAYIPWFWGE